MTMRPEPTPVRTIVMRGGTSRGPVLLGSELPEDETERDRLALALVGDGPSLIDGLGGGSPTTAKVVLVYPGRGDVDLDYRVGNIVIGRNAVDWSGTCGNMTAAVPLFACEEGLVPAAFSGRLRLRNLSTGGIIETTFGEAAGHMRGREMAVRTSYLDPAGSVFGRMLPTDAPRDAVAVAGRSFEASVLDITHPYLFLRYEDVAGRLPVTDAGVVALIEDIRAAVCVRLGLAADPSQAMAASPAVPRVVLLHGGDGADGRIRITAVSMGQVIATVPVTAAMCLAGARAVPGTLPAEIAGPADRTGDIEVAAAGASMVAGVEIDPSGAIRSVAVDRTARSIMRGTAWV